MEIAFHNCTEDCGQDFHALDDDSVVIDRKHKGDPLGAKNDSRLLSLASGSTGWNNGFSEAVSVKARGGFHSGFLVCKACKSFECSEDTVGLFVTDLPTRNGKNGAPPLEIILQLQIILGTYLGPNIGSVVDGENFNLTCGVSKFQYSRISWNKPGQPLELDKDVVIEYWNTSYSLWSNISIRESSRTRHAGDFYCNADTGVSMKHTIKVRDLVKPKIVSPQPSTVNGTRSVELGQNFTLYCGYDVEGDPEPTIRWFKDNSNLTMEPKITGPDSSGAYFKYIPEFEHQNKTLHFTAHPLPSEAPAQSKSSSSSRTSSQVGTLAGKYFCIGMYVRRALFSATFKLFS